EQGGERDRRGGQRGGLRLGARAPVDGGLRGAAARGHGADQASRNIGGAGREQLAVRRRARLAARGKGTSHRNRLGKAHERDAGRGGPHSQRKLELRKNHRRQLLGDGADGGDTGLAQAERRGGRDGERDRDERRRQPRRAALEDEDQREEDKRERQRGRGGLGQVGGERCEVAEKAGLVD